MGRRWTQVNGTAKGTANNSIITSSIQAQGLWDMGNTMLGFAEFIRENYAVCTVTTWVSAVFWHAAV